MPERSPPLFDWESVYDDYLPRVYNFFRYRLQDEALAEDLTATTFEKAWRMRHTYHSDLGGMYTWLLAIARNVAADHFRQHRPENDLIEDKSIGDLNRPVEEHAEKDDDLKRLSDLMAGLSTRERELIALKYGAGLTNRAIAQVTDLSESNVGTLLYRIVHQLRARWDGIVHAR